MLGGCGYTWGIEHAPLISGPGPHSRWVRVAGHAATYDVDFHAHTPAATPPLVIVLHGSGGTGPGMERRTRFSELADREGFVVAYPNSTKNTQGRRLWGTGESFVSDTSMLRALIDTAVARANVDRRRVYLAGFSNGGGMTYRAASAMSRTFAAIGVVAGGGPRGGPARAAEPIPLVAVHGMLDQTVNFDGAPIATRAWAERNGCASTPAVDRVGGDEIVRTRYTRCAADADVVFYAATHGGHGWPNPGTSEAPFATTQAMWDFFAAHAR